MTLDHWLVKFFPEDMNYAQLVKLHDAYQVAIQAERERCAKIAETCPNMSDEPFTRAVAIRIARDIREQCDTEDSV